MDSRSDHFSFEGDEFDMNRHRLLVGVDFGTTNTGVAFCLSSCRNVEDIDTVTTWPGTGGTLEKIPTEICYVKNQTPRWGAEASNTTFQRANEGFSTIYGRFKLLLDPSIGRDVYGEILPKPGFDAGDPTSKISLPPGRNAIEVTSDYLKQLYIHIMNNILRKRMPDTLDNTPIEFIFTVPAIWSHKAQEATRTAAEKAGFGPSGRINDTISMISEPEAAAIYSLAAMHSKSNQMRQFGAQPESLKVGDHFVICDAGGGTVDLISYQIEETFPDLKLRESAVGSGGKCGSGAIDDAFHELLGEKIGPKFYDENVWGPKRKGRGSYLMQQFETCKKSFGQTGNDLWFLELPVSVEDDEANNIMDDELELTAKDMKALFDPVVDDIIKLIEAQARKVRLATNSIWNQTKGELKSVVLVGGFGESQYLYKRVQEWAQQQYPPLSVINPQRSWSAIMRGAVLQALKPAVRTRKLRSHYGFPCATPFDPTRHKLSETKLSIWLDRLVVDDNVEWTAHLGDDCSKEKLVSFDIFKTYSERDRRFDDKIGRLNLLGSRHTEAPERKSSENVFQIGQVRYDYSDVDFDDLPTKTVNGVKYYKLELTVKMKIGSADAKFSVWHDGRCRGEAKIGYDF